MPFENIVPLMPLIGFFVLTRCSRIACTVDSVIKLICAPESQNSRLGNDNNPLDNCIRARKVLIQAGISVEICCWSLCDGVIVASIISLQVAVAGAMVVFVANCYWKEGEFG